MSRPFKIRIGFVEPSPHSPDVLLVGGTVLEGDLWNGAEGALKIEDSQLRLKVLEVAFLEKAPPDAIMFSVRRPSISPALEKWTDACFVSIIEASKC
jgi:hypothetical protein